MSSFQKWPSASPIGFSTQPYFKLMLSAAVHRNGLHRTCNWRNPFPSFLPQLIVSAKTIRRKLTNMPVCHNCLAALHADGTFARVQGSDAHSTTRTAPAALTSMDNCQPAKQKKRSKTDTLPTCLLHGDIVLLQVHALACEVQHMRDTRFVFSFPCHRTVDGPPSKPVSRSRIVDHPLKTERSALFLVEHAHNCR